MQTLMSIECQEYNWSLKHKYINYQTCKHITNKSLNHALPLQVLQYVCKDYSDDQVLDLYDINSLIATELRREMH